MTSGGVTGTSCTGFVENVHGLYPQSPLVSSLILWVGTEVLSADTQRLTYCTLSCACLCFFTVFYESALHIWSEDKGNVMRPEYQPLEMHPGKSQQSVMSVCVEMGGSPWAKLSQGWGKPQSQKSFWRHARFSTVCSPSPNNVLLDDFLFSLCKLVHRTATVF